MPPSCLHHARAVGGILRKWGCAKPLQTPIPLDRAHREQYRSTRVRSHSARQSAKIAPRRPHFFSQWRKPRAGREKERRRAGRRRRDAHPWRTSRTITAAALPRRQSRQGRRLEAPGSPRGRLVATGSSHAAARKSTKSSRKSWRRRGRWRRPCRQRWWCWRSN